MRNFINKHIYIIHALLVFFFYKLTLAKSVLTLDNGELAATSYFLGIPHPPGYPLFTIFGYLFSHLPLGLRVIEKLNLLSSIYAVISIYFTFKILEILFAYLEDKTRGSNLFKFNSIFTNSIIKILSILGGLILAFSKTFWSLATNYEVYSFQMFLLTGFIFFTLKAYDQDKSNSQNIKLNKFWIIAFLFFAGIISNHTMGVFFILFIVIVFFGSNYSSKKITNLFLLISFSFFLSIIIYSYIPIRASQSALAGFGLPYTLKDTFEHITAKVYRAFLFDSISKFFDNLSLFFQSLWFNFDTKSFYGSEFGLSLIFLPLSFFFLPIITRKLFITILVLLIIYIIIPASYGIYDVDAFFIYSYFILVILISSGIYFSLKLLKQKFQKLFLVILVLLISYQIYFNYKRVDNSRDFTAENYYKKIVGSLEPNSILLNYSSWFHSMTLYFQFVENYRSDVTLILYPLASEKWYREQIKNWYKLKGEIITNENGNLSFDFGGRPVYFTVEMLQKITSGNVKISEGEVLAPYGLSFKIVPKGTYVKQSIDLYDLEITRRNNLFTDELEDILFQMILYRIYYELDHGYNLRAKELVNLIRKRFPDRTIPDYMLNL